MNAQLEAKLKTLPRSLGSYGDLSRLSKDFSHLANVVCGGSKRFLESYSSALAYILLRNPGTTAVVIILLVGFTLIVRGIVDIISGLFSKEEAVVDNRWLYAALGALGIILGVIVLTYPAATGPVFIWALGLYAVLFGAFNIGLAFRLRS